jgi:5-methylcytosine-specific restriction endonuclease McrA
MQAKVVESALIRKLDNSAPKSLTVDEWIATLKYFGGSCAYCQVRSYECLEHFIPIKLGGGTSASNVVPSCCTCNKLKESVHPTLVTRIPQEDIERVRVYLQQL